MLDGASFCRGCGANISLVPQALTGQMMQSPVEEIEEGGRRHRRRRDRGELASTSHSKTSSWALRFLIIAIVLSRTIGYGWWFWMLLPAFSMMGTGIAQYIRIKRKREACATRPAAGESGISAATAKS